MCIHITDTIFPILVFPLHMRCMPLSFDDSVRLIPNLDWKNEIRESSYDLKTLMLHVSIRNITVWIDRFDRQNTGKIQWGTRSERCSTAS